MDSTERQCEYLQKQIWKLEDQIIAERKEHQKRVADLVQGTAWLLAIVVGLGIFLGIRMDKRHQAEIAYERQLAVEEFLESLD